MKETEIQQTILNYLKEILDYIKIIKTNPIPIPHDFKKGQILSLKYKDYFVPHTIDGMYALPEGNYFKVLETKRDLIKIRRCSKSGWRDFYFDSGWIEKNKVTIVKVIKE